MKLKILILLLLTTSLSFAADVSEEIVRSDKHLSRVKILIDQEKKAVAKLTDEKKKTARQLRKAEIELNYQRKIVKKIEKKLFQAKKRCFVYQF